MFQQAYEVYTNQVKTADVAAHRGRTLNGSYVLEIGYPLDLFEELVKQGHFSKTIARAIRAIDLSFNIKHPQIMENTNFNPHLLNIENKSNL